LAGATSSQPVVISKSTSYPIVVPSGGSVTISWP